MQPDLHPSWQSESRDVPDDAPDGQPVTVNARRDAPVPSPQTVSRRPAAAFGIVLALGLLAAVYGTSSLLHGQTSPAPQTQTQTGPTVRITESGFDPPILAVRPGDTVTWINESSIPHLLSSQDIETVDGPLDTSPVFPDSSMAVTIAQDAKTGTFRYVSLTSTLSGELTVDTAAPVAGLSSARASSLATADPPAAPSSAVAAAPSSAPMEPSTPRSSLRPLPPVPSSAPDVPVIPTAAVGTLPRNPYALNRPDYVDPVQPSSPSSARSSSSASATVHAGAPLEPPTVTRHTPTSQPGTGPDDWAVVVMAVVAMGTLLVHARKRTAWTYRD